VQNPVIYINPTKRTDIRNGSVDRDKMEMVIKIAAMTGCTIKLYVIATCANLSASAVFPSALRVIKSRRITNGIPRLVKFP
jgi:hypothetical protein